MARSVAEPAPVRIAVVALDALARSAISSALQVAPGVRVVGSAGDRHELAALLAAGEVDAVVLDAGGPRGPEALGEIDVDAPVLALVDDAEAGLIALAKGARAVMSRERDLSRAGAALEAMRQGFVTVAGELAAGVLRRAPRGALAEPLTPRELEVLSLLALGLSNKDIGRRLGISEHTAKFHVNAILAKLGAQGRTEAVVKAAQLGLVAL